MLDKFNDMSGKDKLTVVCGVIFLFVMIFVLSTGFKGELPKHDFKVNAEEVNSVIDDLGDNYIINITETNGDKISNHIYYYDGKIYLYESDTSEYGYLEYNDKRYQMDGVTRELSEYDETVGYIDNPLYDYELIKNFTDSCNYEYLNRNQASCKITLNEYLTYHNSKYNTSYIGSDYEYITIKISYSNKLNMIEIDYSAYNKIVNLGENNVIVKFDFKYNVNKFDAIYENYKDVLGE